MSLWFLICHPIMDNESEITQVSRVTGVGITKQSSVFWVPEMGLAEAGACTLVSVGASPRRMCWDYDITL